MAKVSVSIPDELLERARARHTAATTSQLVQRGLEQLTAELAEPTYAQRPDDAKDLAALAHERFIASIRAQYQKGYRAAADDIGELDLELIEYLADGNFNLVERLESLKRDLEPEYSIDEFTPPEWFRVIAARFGTMVDPTENEDFDFTPPRPFVHGYATALRDVWDIAQNTQSIRGGPASPHLESEE